MAWQKIVLTILFVTPALSVAAPTRRSLPPGIASDNANFIVMRDDKESRTFYLVPKRLIVIDSSLIPFGNQSEGCQAADLYQQAQRKLIEAKLKLIENIGKADNVQILQAEIEGIEQSLAVFEAQVVRPAATVRVRMQVPEALEEARLNFGFRENDNVMLPSIAALSLSPTNLDNLPFSEAIKRKTSVGSFEADWNIKPFAISPGQFGRELLPFHSEVRPFPTELVVTQIVSLFSYCSLKVTDVARPGERILPITVSFTLAVVQDENGSTSSEWVVFHRKLKIKGWNLIESLPVAMASESRIRVDPGHPRLFLRPGVYRPLELSLSIDNNFSTKHPNEGVEK